MPKIKECVKCKQKEKIAYFSIADDGFKCEQCGRIDKSAISISPTVVDAIKYIVSAPDKKIYSFNLNGEEIAELGLVSKVYFNEKIDNEELE